MNFLICCRRFKIRRYTGWNRKTDNKNQAFLAQQKTKEIFGFYDKFQEKIKRVFGNVKEKRNAERRLESLVQNISAVYYASEFQQYAKKID